MASMLHDIRFGWRMLARSPGFTALAVLILGIGIGTATAMFSFVNGVLLRPLPFPASDRLVMLQTDRLVASPDDFLEWRQRSRTFEDMTAFAGATFSLTGGGEPERIVGAQVSPSFFETLAIRPIIGRTLSDLEGEAAAADSAIISAGLWRRRFSSKSDVVGSRLILDGKPFTIAGVMPSNFSFPRDVLGSWGTRMTEDMDVWIPLQVRTGQSENYFLRVIARIKPATSLGQAQAEMTVLSREVDRVLARPRRVGVTVVSLQQVVVGPVRQLLLVFFGAVLFLLLIACTNVANLLLGRASARQREVAIRTALGSGRRRLVQQFLTESILLAAIGGGIGLVFAHWLLTIAPTLIPPGSVPRATEVNIDLQVLTFAVGLSIITGVIFGVAPAFQAASSDVTATLKLAGPTHTARPRLLSMLVVAEMTFAFTLLTGATLLLVSFLRLTNVATGFQVDNLLTVGVTLPDAEYPTTMSRNGFATNMLDRLRPAPDLDGAGAINWLPLGNEFMMGNFRAEGASSVANGVVVAKPAVSPSYFKTMAIPLLEGRPFTDRDGPQSPRVAIVSEHVARLISPAESAVGKRVALGIGEPSTEPWLTIVGVVGEVKQSSLAEQTRPAIYVPLAQVQYPFLLRTLTFVVRTRNPSTAAATIRSAVRAVDPRLPFARIATMEQLLASSVSEPRFRAVIMAGFAATALVLVGSGIIGVLAYSVTRRTREIGVRIALGATRQDVLHLVLREVYGMAIMGVVLGAAAAAGLTKLLARFLYEVRPADPSAFFVAAFLLAAVALVAGYVPTRRAIRIDPLIALRAD